MDDKIKFDDLDRSILRLLKENSRMSYQEMSRHTGISDATIQHRLKRMKEHDAIRFTILPNPDATGYEVTSIMLVQTDTEKHDGAKAALAGLPEITEVYSVLGEHDLFIKVWARNLEELNEFINEKIRAIDGIEEMLEIVVVEKVKEEGPPV
jgi:Lrp/AsnC family transcriptional regulator, regulator for asnA, asnC and gidA